MRGFDLTLNFGTVKFIRLSIFLLQAENFFLLSGDLFFQLNVLIELISIFEQGFQIDIGRVDFSLDVINKSDGFFVERSLVAKIFVQNFHDARRNCENLVGSQLEFLNFAETLDVN